MKYFIVFLLLASKIHAAELSILLPDVTYLMPSVSPPITEKEGQILPYELSTTSKLWPLFQEENYLGALEVLENTYPDQISALKNNIPFEEYSAYVSRSSALYYLIGHTFSSLESLDAAETAYKIALQITPDYIRVHESLGMLYLSEERFDDARTHLARAAELGLNTVTLYGALGFLNQETNNPWGAVSAYQQALMLDHDNFQFQQGLLHAQSESYQYESALALIDQLLQKRKNEPDLWIYRAHMAQQLGNLKMALSSLETAIRLGDNSLENLQVTALLHMQIGSVNRAAALMKLSIIEGMEFQYIDQALQWMILHDEWSLARELIVATQARFDDLNGIQQSKFLTQEATIKLQDKNQAAAQELLEKAIELDPGNPAALMALAEIFTESSQFNKAELLFQRASVYPLYKENALISMAQLAIDQDRLERALMLLRNVVDTNPSRVDLSRNIETLENLILIQ